MTKEERAERREELVGLYGVISTLRHAFRDFDNMPWVLPKGAKPALDRAGKEVQTAMRSVDRRITELEELLAGPEV